MLILVRPHVSLLDGPFVAWKLRKTPAPCGVRALRGVQALFPVDSDYARHPLWSHILRAYGWLLGHQLVALDVERPMGMRTVLQALREEQNVVLFPQGAGLSDSRRPDRPGTQWLLRKSLAPVVHYRLTHWHGIPVRIWTDPLQQGPGGRQGPGGQQDLGKQKEPGPLQGLVCPSPESPQSFAIPERHGKPRSNK